MYCSMCGRETTAGLNFCKKCGSNLNAVSSGSVSVGEAMPVGGVPAGLIGLFGVLIAGVGILGLLGIIEGGGDLARRTGGLSIPMIAMATAVVIVIESMLMRVIMRLLNSYLAGGHAPKGKSIPPPPVASFQLQPPPYRIGSVTEHTTRNFESVRKAAPDTADMD